MSRYIKDLVAKDIENKIGGLDNFLVVDTKGIGGNDNNEMRGGLGEKGIKLIIVKNSMMRKALATMEMTAAMDLFASGPCAVAFGGDSIVDVAREIMDWGKKIKSIEVKGAYVDGMALPATDAIELSKMPSRVELQGSIVMLAKSPGGRVAGAIAAPAGVIAGCIKTIIERDEGKEAA